MSDARIIIEAQSPAEARARAAAQLAAPESELELTELVPPRAGLLSLGRRPGRYRVRRKTAPGARLDQQVQAALAAGEQLDGGFAVDYRDGNALLTVQAPGARGRAVTVEQVLARLRVLDIPAAAADPAAIAAAIAAPGTGLAVAPWPEGDRRDAYFKLTVDADRMTARVQVLPPKRGGAMLTVEDLIHGLAQQGIVSGVRRDNLASYLAIGEFDAPVVAAAGTPPRHGRDASITYLFKTTHSIEFKEDEKGKVDFHELGLIQSVSANAPLAVKNPAEPGVPGEDIYGHILPARSGQDRELHAGKNTRVDSEGVRLLAETDGGVSLIGNAVHVEPVCRIDGDVALATGNIDFDGTVEILGRVADGFRVKATGDIVVAKTVEAAQLEAAGNIIVRGGVLGHGRGTLVAGGDIVVKFAENARLQAHGGIVAELIMHSHLIAEKHLSLGGRRGALMGGSSIIGGAVDCKELGAVGETKTVVQAGVPPQVLGEYTKLNTRLRDLQQQLEKIEQTQQALARAREEGNLTAQQAEQEPQLVALADRLRGQMNAVRLEEQQLQRYTGSHPAAAVHARERAYKGVQLVIGAARLTLTNDYRYTTFRNRSGSMACTTYEGLPTEEAAGVGGAPRGRKERTAEGQSGGGPAPRGQ